MKLIKLQGEKEQYTKVDDDLFDWLNTFKWHENGGYVKTWHKGKRIRMHRLIMNAPDDMQVDHINHDTLDNRRQNLRLCNLKENNRNIRMRKDNTSGYTGIYEDKSTGHWRAVIYVDGKPFCPGSFKTKELAALARDLWAIDLHREFANTNFKVISAG